MFVLAALIARFDEALDWPDDPLIEDEDHVDSWAPARMTAAPRP